MKKIKVPIAFKDKRGKILDLVQEENINAVTMISFAKGVMRGNHFHKKTYQWNYLVSGKIRIVAQMPSQKVRKAIMKPGDFYLTVPHESHALESLEDSLLLVLTKGPRGGQNYESDTFRLKEPLISSK